MNIHDDQDDLEYQRAMQLQMRQISDEQFHRFEGYAAEIFDAFGLDLNTPATKDTPRRFIKALFDATEKCDGNPCSCGSLPPNVVANWLATLAR